MATDALATEMFERTTVNMVKDAAQALELFELADRKTYSTIEEITEALQKGIYGE